MFKIINNLSSTKVNYVEPQELVPVGYWATPTPPGLVWPENGYFLIAASGSHGSGCLWVGEQGPRPPPVASLAHQEWERPQWRRSWRASSHQHCPWGGVLGATQSFWSFQRCYTDEYPCHFPNDQGSMMRVGAWRPSPKHISGQILPTMIFWWRPPSYRPRFLACWGLFPGSEARNILVRSGGTVRLAHFVRICRCSVVGTQSCCKKLCSARDWGTWATCRKWTETPLWKRASAWRMLGDIALLKLLANLWYIKRFFFPWVL